jgi:class 3 adenylate cyclase
MRCAGCGFENPGGMKFCGQCAAPLTQHCPQCGLANPPGFKFCGECATPLAGPPARPQSSAASRQPLAPTRVEAERRQLTVMFCDLVGSTALSARLDPEDYRAVVRQYQQTCAEVIQRHEGYLAQYLGDGLLVYFGYPMAHEDDARRAVRTGLEIVEAIKGRAGPHSPQVRIGIHTGLVVVGEVGAGSRTEQLALGETPNVAARVQSLAEPNTVLVSAVTQRLIEGQFESQPFGSHVVKGLATPVHGARSTVEEAGECFGKAIEVARQQQAKSWGTAHGHQPGTPVAAARQAARSSSSVIRGL